MFEVAAGWCLPESRLDRLEGFIIAAQQANHPLQIAEDVPRFVSALRAGTERRTRLEAIYPQGADDPALRDLLSAPLFVHGCHCRWCQRETGSAFALNAMIEAPRMVMETK